MGIRIIDGDLLQAKERLIAHQTNCVGVMGAGVAAQIRRAYPTHFKRYKAFCDNRQPCDILGTIHLSVGGRRKDRVICDLFGQTGVGYGCQTNYAALAQAVSLMCDYCKNEGISDVALPYNIGCGLAGGDWNIVYTMLEKIFTEKGINCTLYRLEGSQNNGK